MSQQSHQRIRKNYERRETAWKVNLVTGCDDPARPFGFLLPSRDRSISGNMLLYNLFIPRPPVQPEKLLLSADGSRPARPSISMSHRVTKSRFHAVSGLPWTDNGLHFAQKKINISKEKNNPIIKLFRILFDCFKKAFFSATKTPAKSDEGVIEIFMVSSQRLLYDSVNILGWTL